MRKPSGHKEQSMQVPFKHVFPRKSRYVSRLSASLSLVPALALALLCASGVAQAGDFTTKDGCYQVSFSQMTQTGAGATFFKGLVISDCQKCVEGGKLYRYTSEGRGTDLGTCLEKPSVPPNPYAGIVAIPAGTTDLAKFMGESCYLWGVFVNNGTQCKIQGDCATKGHIVSAQQVVGSPILVGSALTSNSPDTFGRYIALVNGTRKVWVKVGEYKPNNCLVDMGGASDGPLKVGDKAPASFQLLRNRNKPGELAHAQNGTPAIGADAKTTWWSAHWLLEPIPDTPYFRLRNRYQEPKVLHVQSGPLELGEAPLGWWSAQWKQEPVEGYVRLCNRYKPTFCLHNQNGPLEAGTVGPGWWSAMWTLESAPQ
jgi:hypothetical protein